MLAAPPLIDPSDTREVVALKRQLQLAHLVIDRLQERLRLNRIKKYGPASEKLNDAQLELLEGEPGVSDLEVAVEAERAPVVAAPKARPGRQRKHPGRQSLPEGLPRVERVIACPPEQCACQRCGEPMEVIGYERSEQLDVEPAKYFVLVTQREKRACRCCEQSMTTAPAPVRIIDKGLVSDRVVIDTLVSKYCDHLPLYRQSVIWERETGIEISRATLDGWVMRVGELLIPLSGAIRGELLRGGYMQADETPVEVQMHDGRGHNHQAYLWQYGKPGGAAVFDFQLGRGRAGPEQFLRGFRGLLQTDGYAAYEKLGGGQIVHAGCWTHTRRPFFEAHKLSPSETVAKSIVESIDDLFAIDALARERHYDEGERAALRAERAPVVLETIRAKVEGARGQALPSSKLGQAVTYALGQWPKLTRFLKHPQLELSNNLAENSMRPVAVGRKNWIHVGSAEAGPRVAAILSIMETCRRLSAPVRAYLAATLPGLADTPIQKLPELTPAAWAARNR